MAFLCTQNSLLFKNCILNSWHQSWCSKKGLLHLAELFKMNFSNENGPPVLLFHGIIYKEVALVYSGIASDKHLMPSTDWREVCWTRRKGFECMNVIKKKNVLPLWVVNPLLATFLSSKQEKCSHVLVLWTHRARLRTSYSSPWSPVCLSYWFFPAAAHFNCYKKPSPEYYDSKAIMYNCNLK